MIYKQQLISDLEIDHPCGYQWGSRPKGILKSISDREFWHIISGYSPIYIAYNQIQTNLKDFEENRSEKIKNTMLSANLFYFGDYVLVVEYEFWQNRTNFWKIMICNHDYREISASESNKLGVHHFGNCYHVYKCEKCGKTYGVDSSG